MTIADYTLSNEVSQLVAVTCVVSMIPVFSIALAALFIRTLRAFGWEGMMKRYDQ